MTTLRRLPTWDVALRQYFERTRTAPLEWSVSDCGAWPLGAVDAMCGTQLAAGLAGEYTDFDGAVAYCQRRGWATLADALVELGCARLPTPLRTQRGDVVFLAPRDVVPLDRRFHVPSLGILMLNIDGSLYVPSPDGLQKCPLLAAVVLEGVGYAVGRTL